MPDGNAADNRACKPGSATGPAPTAVDVVRGTDGAVHLERRPRIVALGISADIERASSTVLVGRTSDTHERLAELAHGCHDARVPPQP